MIKEYRPIRSDGLTGTTTARVMKLTDYYNSETGEVEVYHSDSTTIEPQTFDEETGEPLSDKFKVRYKKHKSFQIPKKYLRGSKCGEFGTIIKGDYRDVNECQPITVQTPSNPKSMEAVKKPKTQLYQHDDYIDMEGVGNDHGFAL